LIRSPMYLARMVVAALCLGSGTGRGNAEPGLTNVAGLRALNRVQMNRGRQFSLTGSITMADPQRNVFVLQDSTGAILVHPDAPVEVTPGTLVEVQAESAAPYVVNFPDYPF